MPLPEPSSSYGLSAEAFVAAPARGDEIVYRLIGRQRPRARDFFSDQAKGRVAPPGTPWIDFIGLSVFHSLDGLLEIADRYPVLIAEMALPPGPSCYLAQSFFPGHYTLWADPELLLASVRTRLRKNSPVTPVLTLP